MAYGFRRYVPVRERKAKVERETASMRKKGVAVQPVRIEGRLIAHTFWGKAWCDHLESFSESENRLPRGRTYVRNGSVCHLEINPGLIHAKVQGSALYTVTIEIEPLGKPRGKTSNGGARDRSARCSTCSRGGLSDGVMPRWSPTGRRASSLLRGRSTWNAPALTGP